MMISLLFLLPSLLHTQLVAIVSTMLDLTTILTVHVIIVVTYNTIYLLNTTKYFTSNPQLIFLTGLHHFHTDLIIQNVHSISFIGSTTNGTQSRDESRV